MAGPGGRIAPDGRPARAPGVGKNARRHDLEAPATPGLHGSDLQQGDVQMLEQGQRVAPRPKKNQAAAAPPSRQAATRKVSNNAPMEVPDPIEFAAGRIGGSSAAPGTGGRVIDPTPWLPIMRAWAMRPNSGGALAANYNNMLTQFAQRPIVPRANFVDFNALDEIIAEGL